jgi:hypothetical protein
MRRILLAWFLIALVAGILVLTCNRPEHPFRTDTVTVTVRDEPVGGAVCHPTGICQVQP